MAMWHICTFWQSRRCDNGQWPAIHLIRILPRSCGNATLNTSAPQCIIRSKTVLWNHLINKYLKHGIQTFQAAHKTFANGITELLFNSRTSHWRASAPLNVFTTAEYGQIVNHRLSRTKRTTTQRQAPRNNTEHRPTRLSWSLSSARHGTHTTFSSTQGVKMPFSRSLQITQVLGNYTYKLSDGQIWHARKLVRHVPPTPDSIEGNSDRTTPRANINNSTFYAYDSRSTPIRYARGFHF